MLPVGHVVRLDTSRLFSVLVNAGPALKHPAYAILTQTPLPFYVFFFLVTGTSSFKKYVFISLALLPGCLTLGHLEEFMPCFGYS